MTLNRLAVIFLAAASCAANPAPVAYESGAPTLAFTASPRLGLPPLTVTLRATLTGLESEKWYCRPVEWQWPDRTRSTFTEDCVPWARHTPEDYVRRWTRMVRLGAPGEYEFGFTLIGGDGRTLATQTTRVTVAGGGD